MTKKQSVFQKISKFVEKFKDAKDFNSGIAVVQKDKDWVYINTKGLGSANLDGKKDEMLLAERELRQVFHGDRVKVQQTSVDRKGKAWGFVTEVTQRRVKQIIGKLNEYEGEYFVQPSNPIAHQPIT